jgi:hypothetical protein
MIKLWGGVGVLVGGRKTHCKLGQYIGSGSHSNANHVLEPGAEQAGHSRAGGAISHETNQGRPRPQPPAGSVAWWALLAPSSRERQGTHPKCCTTLGSMAASCSMEGNWYL